jgi:phenylacetate-CoA ligase
MDLYAPIVRNVVAPLWALKERSPYLRHYQTLLESQYQDPADIHELQWRKLKQILDYAYQRSPFYQRRFAEHGLTPAAIQNPDDFRKIPLLTKHDLRNAFSELACMKPDDPGVFTKTTSGWTGIKVAVLLDEDSGQFKRACTLRADEWSGWRLGEKVAAVWGNPEYRKSWRGRLRNLLLERRQYLDTLDMRPEDIDAFAQLLRRWQPSQLFGHAHSVYLFA